LCENGRKINIENNSGGKKKKIVKAFPQTLFRYLLFLKRRHWVKSCKVNKFSIFYDDVIETRMLEVVAWL